MIKSDRKYPKWHVFETAHDKRSDPINQLGKIVFWSLGLYELLYSVNSHIICDIYNRSSLFVHSYQPYTCVSPTCDYLEKSNCELEFFHGYYREYIWIDSEPRSTAFYEFASI